MSTETYGKMYDILSGEIDITNHVRKIFDGEIYSNDEINTFINSICNIVVNMGSLREMIFFDCFNDKKKMDFMVKKLDICDSNLYKLNGSQRILASPKSGDITEFVKRSLYFEGLFELYGYIKSMYHISVESFIAIWSLAMTSGSFNDIIPLGDRKENSPPVKKKRK